MYSGKQVQTPLSHSVFGPHGDGLQRSTLTGASVVGGIRVQMVNGSPVCPSSQLQIGKWFSTWQRALVPQDPGQGSRHLLLMHARGLLHSELITHSGLQFGGTPIKSGKQEHEGVSPIIWQTELGPHGDGWQDGGFGVEGSTSTAKYIINVRNYC